jgi:hypothetical protein
VAAPAIATPEPAAPAGWVPPYFYAAQEVGWGDPKLFRFYIDAEALLMIYAGPYHMAMIDGLKRLRGEAEDPSTTGKAISRTAALGAQVGGVTGAGVGLVAGAAVGGLVWVGAKIAGGQVDKRCAVIDTLDLDGLRREAETGKHCLLIEPNQMVSVELRPIERGLFSRDDLGIAGYLTFKHLKAGSWTLKLITLPDARDAAREFRRLLGFERVKVTFPF